jgi:XTP/dITP diphosphohydrolase
MKDVENRRAHFTSAIALVFPDGKELVTEGHTYGEILHKETGDGGFGYDCLFFSEDLQKSFGVATAEEKNRVSHRFRGLQAMLKLWQGQDK